MAKEKEIEISYRERLKIAKEIEAIEKKITDGVNIQAKTRQRYNDLLDKSFTTANATLSLDKQLNRLQKSSLGEAKKELGLDKQLLLVQKTKEKGSLKEIKNAGKLTELMADVASGSKDFSAALKEIADEDFGSLNDVAKDFGKTLSEGGEELEKNVKRSAKFGDMFDDVREKVENMSEILSSPQAMGAAVIGLLVKGFTDIAGQAIEIRKDLGLSAGESASLATKTTILSKAFSLIGGDGEQIAAFSKAIASEFGSINQLSFKTLTNFGLLSLRTGITGDNAAKLAKSIQSIQGGSLETSLNTISTFENLSRAAGVAPKLVLDDVAESTELFAKFAKDGGENLAKAAIEARKLGLNLSAVDKISESILDFETSIEKQMEASVLLGRQLNLDKARELALSGDLEGVLAEVKNQVGGAEALSRMNVIQRKALADAVGLEVSELSKLAAGEEVVGKAQEERNALLFRNMKIGAAIGATLLGIAMALKAVITSGFTIKDDIKNIATAGFAGIAGGAAIGAGAGALVPRAQTGGVVRESGLAVVHKGETIAGTQFGGRESNKLLKQMIEQNATLMNRLTNRVGDLALSS